MLIIHTIFKTYLIGALFATLMMQTGLVKYAGTKCANPVLTLILFAINVFNWPQYLCTTPLFITRLYNVSYATAMDMQNSYFAEMFNTKK